MSKKKKAKALPENTAEAVISTFEIGQKGDDFDLEFTKFAKYSTVEEDNLLYDLSREEIADKHNFTASAVYSVMLVFVSLVLAVIGRGDIEHLFDVKLSVESVLSGSYTEMLESVYEKTLPYNYYIKLAGAYLGFNEMPEKPMPEEVKIPDTPVVTEPIVTTPPVTTTEVTTVTEEITTVTEITTTITTLPALEDTTLMYATNVLNIRLGPTTKDAVLGYFNIGEEVNVVEIREDGWASILYSEIIAYVHADYLSYDPPVVETEPPVTEAPETTTEVTTVGTSAPETTTEETTTSYEDWLYGTTGYYDDWFQ